jgi:hypothetical protein
MLLRLLHNTIADVIVIPWPAGYLSNLVDVITAVSLLFFTVASFYANATMLRLVADLSGLGGGALCITNFMQSYPFKRGMANHLWYGSDYES